MIFDRIKWVVDRIIATFSILVMVALVVCVVWQVFSRYVLGQPSTMTDELARFLMIWVGLLGAAYTVGAQRHLSIDILALSLSERKKQVLNILINLFIFLFAGGVIISGGLKLIEKNPCHCASVCSHANSCGLCLFCSAVKWRRHDVLFLMVYCP